MIVIPLARDGCVDCEVDEEAAIRMIRLGCEACVKKQPHVARAKTSHNSPCASVSPRNFLLRDKRRHRHSFSFCVT